MSSPVCKKMPGPCCLLLGLAVILSACGQHTVRESHLSNSVIGTAPVEKPVASVTLGQRAATVAVRQIGIPYRYGGNTVSGFDCSGLAQFAYSSAGQRIPRTTRAQWRNLAPVAKNELQVGDLLFFRISGSISHVGLYLGRDRFVHAPSSGREVIIETLDSTYYKRSFVRGGRP